MHTFTLAELAKKLRAKEFSVTELTKSLLGRIEASQPKLNAFITVTADSALAQAQAADAALASGKAGPLTGLPLAHKDIFCTQGVKTSCGSRMLDNFVSPYDATVVEKLNAAGMVTLGKTNMDEFAMGSSNETSYYGPVKNPWDLATGAGRLLGWFGRGGGRAGFPDRHGHRHRWFDPPARVAVRRHRHQAYLRPRLALRHDRVRLQPRPGRADLAVGRGCRHGAGRHGRLRSARLHQRRHAGA